MSEALEFAEALERLAALYRDNPAMPVPKRVGDTFRIDVYEHVHRPELPAVLAANPDRVEQTDSSDSCAFVWDFGPLVFRRFVKGELVGSRREETVTRFEPYTVDDLRRVHGPLSSLIEGDNTSEATKYLMAQKAERLAARDKVQDEFLSGLTDDELEVVADSADKNDLPRVLAEISRREAVA